MNELLEWKQDEQIKNYCRKHGGNIIALLIFIFALSLGWSYWQKTRENNLIKASVNYENLVAAMNEGNTELVKNKAKVLLTQYSTSPYASIAAFQLAKYAVSLNELSSAAMHLNWVIDHTKNASLRSIAHIRLARVLFAENQTKQALQVLENDKNKVFQPLVLLEKGNIFLHLGQPKQALQNYLSAQKLFAENSSGWLLVTMKINNLTELDRAD
jgi:predicted negative regulator of RcsB-dependent stress response